MTVGGGGGGGATTQFTFTYFFANTMGNCFVRLLTYPNWPSFSIEISTRRPFGDYVNESKEIDISMSIFCKWWVIIQNK